MFYNNFVNLCNSRGTSPSKTAEEMGFQRSVVTRWSKGTVPRQATLQKIATFFGVSVDELLGSAPEQTKKAPGEIAGGQSEKVVEAMKLLSTLDDQRLELALAHLRLLEKLDNE